MLPSIGEPSSKSRHVPDRPGNQPIRRFWSSIALLVVAGLPMAGVAETVTVVAPAGLGILTKCRNWLIATSCRTYQHIKLPARITVGDTVTLSFGGYPKEYRFYVAKIEVEDARCTILSAAEAAPDEIDKIDITPRHRAPESK